MTKALPKKTHRGAQRPPFECIALVLQGGGALGAYQAGVYQALAEAGLHPDWIAGISIGAINSALIAGNPPAQRIDRLRAFWEEITESPAWAWGSGLVGRAHLGDRGRELLNKASAVATLTQGAPGFFVPRIPAPTLLPPGTIEATSYYDTTPLRATLERLVDFDRINSNEMRFSVGAVNVRSGNFVYFDSTTDVIRPEHIMASGALPPGFSAVEIDGEFYWDGGLISNTPLQWVVDSDVRQDTLAFQVDLWSARGEIPASLAEVAVRQKEITYSSRTRASTDQFKHIQMLRNAAAELIQKLPPELRRGPQHDLLSSFADRKLYNLVHLIYRTKHYEGDSKDYEFSRLSMEEHWQAGYHDATRTLRHPEVLERPTNPEGVSTFDLAQDGRE